MQNYLDYIKQHGIFLKDKTGTLDWALRRAHALEALEILRNAQVPNLGGDVVAEKDGKYKYFIDEMFLGAWHSDKKDDESKEAYVLRSLSESKEYIERYPEKEGFTFYYVLVPKTENTLSKQEGKQNMFKAPRYQHKRIVDFINILAVIVGLSGWWLYHEHIFINAAFILIGLNAIYFSRDLARERANKYNLSYKFLRCLYLSVGSFFVIINLLLFF